MRSRATTPYAAYHGAPPGTMAGIGNPATQTAGQYWASVDRAAGWMGWWFLIMLGAVLSGYAFLGRGFAYLGVAPLYIGEITLGVGILAAYQSRALSRTFSIPLVRVLVLFIVWGILNTLPYVRAYGVDALRDAVLWGYGLFAIVVVAVLLAHPDRIRRFIIRYRVFALVFALGASAIQALSELTNGGFTLPGAPSPILSAKAGDMMVHLTGVVAFTIIGFTNRKPLILILAGLDSLLIMVSNRGGMVSFFLAIALLATLRPPRFRWTPAFYTIAVGAIMIVMIDPVIKLDDRRTASLEQIQENFESLSFNARATQLESTKAWRISWWTDITEYTVFGKYFFTGKGYGINLANADGYQVNEDESLRAPHNVHMSFLARSGVPGAAIWLVFIVWWFLAMYRAARRARRKCHEMWFGLFAFFLTYWTAFVINATFDVFLEGPMGGIWFWCLTGVGIALLELYRSQPEIFLESPAERERSRIHGHTRR